MTSADVFDIRRDLHDIALRARGGMTTTADAERLVEIAMQLIPLHNFLQALETEKQ